MPCQSPNDSTLRKAVRNTFRGARRMTQGGKELAGAALAGRANSWPHNPALCTASCFPLDSLEGKEARSWFNMRRRKTLCEATDPGVKTSALTPSVAAKMEA